MQVKDTPDAPAAAKKELEKLGPLSLNEKITAGKAGARFNITMYSCPSQRSIERI